MSKLSAVERSGHMMELATLELVEGTRAQDKDVVLFALSTCPHCRHAREHEVQYRYVYVDHLKGEEQKTAVTEAEKFNPNDTFPTLVIDADAVIIGFRESEYEDKL
jgi:glutaredoxin-like protein NrdH